MNLDQYLTDSQTIGSPWWLYKFPNGHTASVIPDRSHTFRFEIESSDPADLPARTLRGLSTEQVEKKLTAIRDLPPAEANEE